VFRADLVDGRRGGRATWPRNSGQNSDGAFAPGNPDKHNGARCRATLAATALLGGEADGLTRKAVELALAGDVTALRLCMDRGASAPKHAPFTFAPPALTGWRVTSAHPME
jgi:hypothetical protein